MTRAALAVAVALGLLVVGSLAAELRRERRELREEVGDRHRFVDFGIELRVAVADPDGQVLVDGKPRMRVVRSHRFGGVVDTRAAKPYIVPDRPSTPVVWYCSEDQERVLLHDDPAHPGQLVYGAEGAGKTRVLAMWHVLQVLRHLGERREGGQTAPTSDRLDLVLRELQAICPATWIRYRPSEGIVYFADGSRVRLVSAYRQSKAQGSPIQGFNWSWAGIDEGQDQTERHDDITARGRAARDGVYPQLMTATAKDDSTWRTCRDSLTRSGWVRRTLLLRDRNGAHRCPFVPASYIDDVLAKKYSAREFARRVFAEDLPPERMVYFNWTRERNLRPIPQVGARRITSLVLSRKTNDRRHQLLVGNDPGTAKMASVFLDAYQLPGEPDPAWWARAELLTRHRTTEQHAREVLAIARDRFRVNHPGQLELAHVRAHPYGQAKNKPDLDVYRIFERVGLHVKAAQYSKDGKGTGLIKTDTRIEMVNSLFLDTSGRVRLYIECDELGRPACPQLVEALESLERDDKGQAEHDAKDEHDLTDLPAALGYALWPWEKESARALRADVRKDLS